MVVRVSWQRLTFISVVVVFSIFAVGFLLYSAFYGVRNVSIKDVVSTPQDFDGIRVRLRGYVVETSYMFGPKYVLRNFEDKVEVALGGKGGADKVDLQPYVSFVFDGENYTRMRDMNVSIVGTVRYVGLVIDAPPVSVDVEEVEPTLDALKTILIEFLKTTDVPKGLGNFEAVEIKEVYDHKSGGWVIVAEYTTTSAIHPDFMAEAIEHHRAEFIIDEEGRVMSAFCLWGSFHNNKVWDLINQKWIQKET